MDSTTNFTGSGTLNRNVLVPIISLQRKRGAGLPLIKVFGGTPNALLVSAKAEQGQVQNWNTQFFSKSLGIFDFCCNLEQNRNSTLKNGIHFKIPDWHCQTVFT